MAKYRVVHGLNYRPNGYDTLPETRAEVGDIVDNLPPAAIGWLVENGHVVAVAPEIDTTPEGPVAPVVPGRQDGPTPQEWVRAGYAADAYPPHDYAAKRNDGTVTEDLEAARAEAQAEAAVMAAEQVKANAEKVAAQTEAPENAPVVTDPAAIEAALTGSEPASADSTAIEQKPE